MRVGAWTEMGSPDVMARCVMYGARALTHDWQKYQKSWVRDFREMKDLITRVSCLWQWWKANVRSNGYEHKGFPMVGLQ